MSEHLKDIDRELITLEESLLAEIGRLRKAQSAETYSPIEPTRLKQFRESYTALVKRLEGGADWTNLSIKSFEQDWVEDRMRVVRNLLISKLPTAFLMLSHEEHKQTRKSDFATSEHQASMELAILSEQVNLHHVEGQSISKVLQDRAEFDSRELSRGHAQESIRERKARSADELRQKLAGKTGTGSSNFHSKDIASLNETTTGKQTRKFAQSPEEIRRKLQERAAGSSQGASTFLARDLSSSTPPPALAKPPPASPAAGKIDNGPIAQSPEEIRRKLAARQKAAAEAGRNSSGRAVFGAKDLSGARPPEPPPPRKEKEKEKAEKKEPQPASGRAIFESRDLSDPKS